MFPSLAWISLSAVAYYALFGLVFIQSLLDLRYLILVLSMVMAICPILIAVKAKYKLRRRCIWLEWDTIYLRYGYCLSTKDSSIKWSLLESIQLTTLSQELRANDADPVLVRLEFRNVTIQIDGLQFNGRGRRLLAEAATHNGKNARTNNREVMSLDRKEIGNPPFATY